MGQLDACLVRTNLRARWLEDEALDYHIEEVLRFERLKYRRLVVCQLLDDLKHTEEHALEMRARRLGDRRAADKQFHYVNIDVEDVVVQ